MSACKDSGIGERISAKGESMMNTTDEDPIFEATGLTQQEYGRHLFPDMVKAAAMLAVIGVDPSRALASDFMPDATFNDSEFRKDCSLLGISFSEINGTGYIASWIAKLVHEGYGNGGRPEYRVLAPSFATASIRFIVAKHPNYKDDLLNIAPRIMKLYKTNSKPKPQASPTSTTKVAASSGGGCLMAALAGLGIAAAIPMGIGALLAFI